MDIYERDKIRFLFLAEAYKITNASTMHDFDLKELGNELKINNAEIENSYYYLKDEGFIEPYGMGYTVTLSHYGIKAIESVLRKIDFDSDEGFNSTELFQLHSILKEIKEQIQTLKLGQEVIFNKIDEAYEKSKNTTKKEWNEYFGEQIKSWASQKVIDKSARIIIEGLLIGLKINSI
jgi:DNA-binding transcriptional regulator YhcF (GntR family)